MSNSIEAERAADRFTDSCFDKMFAEPDLAKLGSNGTQWFRYSVNNGRLKFEEVDVKKGNYEEIKLWIK